MQESDANKPKLKSKRQLARNGESATLSKRLIELSSNTERLFLKEVAQVVLDGLESCSALAQPEPDAPLSLHEQVRNFEISLIRCALTRTSGNQRRAAKSLRISPTTLNMKLKRYGMLDEYAETSETLND